MDSITSLLPCHAHLFVPVVILSTVDQRNDPRCCGLFEEVGVEEREGQAGRTGPQRFPAPKAKTLERKKSYIL